MGLYLNHMWLHIHSINRFFQKILRKIGKADCLDPALFICFLDVPVTFPPVVGRLMQEEQVDIIRTKARKRLINRCILFIYSRP